MSVGPDATIYARSVYMQGQYRALRSTCVRRCARVCVRVSARACVVGKVGLAGLGAGGGEEAEPAAYPLRGVVW
eukprot:2951402-Rhodomonas_salina.3